MSPCIYSTQHMGEQIALYQKRDALALSINKTQVFTFNLDGSFLSYFNSGNFYQRSLGHSLLNKTRHGGQLVRQTLTEADRDPLFLEWYKKIQYYLSLVPQAEVTAQAVAQKILAHSPESHRCLGQEFQALYQPISILPPDQYTCIVLQLTEGCSYNQCDFCDFYKNRPFRIKTPQDFRTHVLAVKDFVRAQLPYRKQIFLADGDALMVPQKRLITCLEILREHFPKRPLFSFMDAFRPQVKSQNDYEVLKSYGLQRVYFGIETSNPNLLKFIGKPGSPELMHEEILKFKAAGLQVGLIFMVGVGGKDHAQAHFKDSIEWIHSLPLETQDIVYLSEFIVHPDQPYAKKSQEAGITSFDDAERQAELKRWRQALKTTPAKVSAYRLNEFIY